MAIKEKNILEIPEGKVLTSAKIYCERHGEITDKSFFLSYVTDDRDANNNIIKNTHNHLYCTACLCEYLESLKKNGTLAEIKISPVFRDKEEVEKEMKERMAKLEQEKRAIKQGPPPPTIAAVSKSTIENLNN
jgi:hypothetical protein